MGARGSFRGLFNPRAVPEVASGYFWDPTSASGSASANFVLPEGNGKTAYDMIAPSVAVAPAIGTINGQAVVTFANATPDKTSRAAANVQRGFTGAAMIWGWFSTPGPNIGLVLQHGRATLQFGLQLNTADVRVYVHDGSSTVESRFPNPTYASGPFYYEGLFVPSAAATSRIQLTIDMVAQVPTLAGSPGTTMQDSSEVMGFACNGGDSSNFNLSADFSAGVSGMTFGIPSDDNRLRLFNYRRLK